MLLQKTNQGNTRQQPVCEGRLKTYLATCLNSIHLGDKEGYNWGKPVVNVKQLPAQVSTRPKSSEHVHMQSIPKEFYPGRIKTKELMHMSWKTGQLTFHVLDVYDASTTNVNDLFGGFNASAWCNMVQDCLTSGSDGELASLKRMPHQMQTCTLGCHATSWYRLLLAHVLSDHIFKGLGGWQASSSPNATHPTHSWVAQKGE